MSDPSGPALPELRASDRDREGTADRLRAAAGDGQLTLDELDERLSATYAARTRAELERITTDLQPIEGDPAPAGGGFAVRRGTGGARWLIAIMGGCERKGRWRLAERCTSINLMGGSDLDLTDVELAGEHVELTVFSLMGGAEIHLPPGLDVEISEFALMGGNSIDVPPRRRTGARPVLHLRLVSIMGGTDVKRGPKLTRQQRRELRRQGRGHLGH